MQDPRTKNAHRDVAIRAANGRRRRSRLLTYALAVCLAAMLPLTGCTSSPVANPSTTASVSDTGSPPTATATSSPTPPPAAVYKPATSAGPAQNVPVPVLPAKAKEFSKEGLIAFTEHWYSTLGYAFETGDPEPMMAISDPSCKTCEVMRKAVISGHKDGKWIMGGTMDITPPTSTFNVMPDGTYQAITLARQNQVRYFKADGTLSKDLGATVSRGDILIGRYQDTKWIAITVEHLEKLQS